MLTSGKAVMSRSNNDSLKNNGVKLRGREMTEQTERTEGTESFRVFCQASVCSVLSVCSVISLPAFSIA
jgi:hypothetical protein